MKKNILYLSILVLISCATLLHAAPPGPPPLPAGVLYSLSGETSATEGFGTDSAVVLVLLNNVSTGGEQLLTFIESMKSPLPAGRLLVVVGNADENLLKQMAARHGNLTADWYRDTDDLLAKGLALKASPAIMGVRDGRVFWTTFGITNRDLLEKTMSGWVN